MIDPVQRREAGQVTAVPRPARQMEIVLTALEDAAAAAAAGELQRPTDISGFRPRTSVAP